MDHRFLYVDQHRHPQYKSFDSPISYQLLTLLYYRAVEGVHGSMNQMHMLVRLVAFWSSMYSYTNQI